METAFDFIRAAAPWAAMGLLIAVIAVRSAVGKKKSKESDDDYGIEGMFIGMCLGIALGTAKGNNIGISLGMFGLAVGMCVPKRKEDTDK